MTGRLAIENGSTIIDERELPGRQGRLAFAFLVAERHRPVSREQFAAVIWSGASPRESETAMSAVLSKLRGTFRKAGFPENEAGVDVLSGAIQLRLPTDTSVDIEAVAHAADEADGALRSAAFARAWGHAVTTVVIARRPFLPGEDAPWIEGRRARLRSILVRGLRALSELSHTNGEHALAVQYASEMIDVEPFQESAYRDLMRLHAGMGNRAEAVRVFGRCRELLREELGASPSKETEAVFLEILRAG